MAGGGGSEYGLASPRLLRPLQQTAHEASPLSTSLQSHIFNYVREIDSITRETSILKSVTKCMGHRVRDQTCLVCPRQVLRHRATWPAPPPFVLPSSLIWFGGQFFLKCLGQPQTSSPLTVASGLEACATTARFQSFTNKLAIEWHSYLIIKYEKAEVAAGSTSQLRHLSNVNGIRRVLYLL